MLQYQLHQQNGKMQEPTGRKPKVHATKKDAQMIKRQRCVLVKLYPTLAHPNFSASSLPIQSAFETAYLHEAQVPAENVATHLAPQVVRL